MIYSDLVALTLSDWLWTVWPVALIPLGMLIGLLFTR